MTTTLTNVRPMAFTARGTSTTAFSSASVLGGAGATDTVGAGIASTVLAAVGIAVMGAAAIAVVQFVAAVDTMAAADRTAVGMADTGNF